MASERFFERLTFRAGPSRVRRGNLGASVFRSAAERHKFWNRQARTVAKRRRQARHKLVAGTGTVPRALVDR